MNKKTLFGKISEAYDSTIVKLAHVGTVCSVSSALTNNYFGNPIYHLSGFLSCAIGRTIDHISTIDAIKLFSKPEFKKYESKSKYVETNIMSSNHPTMEEYKKKAIIQEPIVLTLCTIFPALGYGILSLSPFVYKSNKDRTKEMELDLEDCIAKENQKKNEN